MCVLHLRNGDKCKKLNNLGGFVAHLDDVQYTLILKNLQVKHKKQPL